MITPNITLVKEKLTGKVCGFATSLPYEVTHDEYGKPVEELAELCVKLIKIKGEIHMVIKTNNNIHSGKYKEYVNHPLNLSLKKIIKNVRDVPHDPYEVLIS